MSVVIVDAARTAIGKFGGSLSGMPAAMLGAELIKALVARNQLDPATVDEVILGQVLTAGVGGNPARQSVVHGGLPVHVPGFTVNKLCGSGLKAVHLAYQAITSGEAEIVLAGGQESMSQSAHVLRGSRDGQRMGDWKLIDSMLSDALLDPFQGYHMGQTAENVAERLNISRAEQDQFALASQNKAEAAIKAGRFVDEIVPVLISQRKGDPIRFAQDEQVRFGATLESLSGLKPAFVKTGSVTAGNASSINDGAAVLLLMSEKKAAQLGLTPLARISSCGHAALEPEVMGLGPVPASQNALKKAGWSHQQLDLLEVNEAFAAQALGVHKQMGWDVSKINVNGGAIALGHPVGCSGARVLTTLLYEMKRRDAKKGLASLCIGGGQGVAICVER